MNLLAYANIALAALVAVACITGVQALDAGCLVNKAALDYVGLQSVTKTPKNCISWSLTPYATSDSLFPEKNVSLAKNYCRNPGYSKSTIWCYVNATSLEFDFCDTLPICQTTCRQTEAGQEYNGFQQTDASGTNCLSWVSVNKISSEFFMYDRTLTDANTYCRNVPPNVNSTTVLHSVPWCYVNSSSPFLSDCSIQFCSQLSAGGCRTDQLGQLYRGTVGISVSGKSCLAWNSTSVYTAATWPVLGESIGAAGSSCRNPNNSTVGLWCFVSATQWEPCMVTACEPKTSCPSSTLDYYRFRMNQTRSGCQSWSSIYASSASTWYSFTQLPPGSSAVLSSPLFHPAHLPDAALTSAASFCRNPDNDATGPWCPSPTGGKLYCSDPCNNVTCLTSFSTSNYIGKVSTTRRGVTCQKWIARYPWVHSYATTGTFPDLSISDASNLCRNPDGNPFGPWCIKSDNITDSDFWDFCSVATCPGVSLPAAASPTNVDECLTTTSGFTYAGTKSMTFNGRECQRWDSQTPHPHPYYLAQMFNALTISDASNYCRNPNNDTNGPWCFTTDASVRFEYCNISLCTPIYPPAVEGFLAFLGVLSTHSVILTGMAAVLLLVQALASHVESSRREAKQGQQDASVEPRIERSSSARLHHRQKEPKPKATKATTKATTTMAMVATDGTLDRKLYRRDPIGQRSSSSGGTSGGRVVKEDVHVAAAELPPPGSKFSHNNAVMKAMANTGEPDIWVVGGDPALIGGSLQPIREEDNHQQNPHLLRHHVDPQPPPSVRETETLERRLDFDAESMESASLPKRSAAASLMADNIRNRRAALDLSIGASGSAPSAK